MIQAVQNLPVELPRPVQSAQNSSASSYTKRFGKVKDDVFEAHGLKDKEPKTENADPALIGLTFLMRAAQPEDVSTENEQTELSKCSGPAEGIAGILEGFGLLNPDGSLTSEAAELLEAAYDAAAARETAGTPSAGTPPFLLSEQTPEGLFNLSDDQSIPAGETQRNANALIALLAPLAGDFIRSLENAHSPTAAEASPVQTAAAAAETGEDVLGKLMAAIQAALGEKEPAPVNAALAQPAAAKTTPSDDTSDTTPLNAAAEFRTAQNTFDATLQEAPAAQETAVTSASETVMDLVDSLSAKTAEGAQEFEITLKPEYLGKLSIKLTQDGDGIKAHIKAADAAVRNLLLNETSLLQSMLKEKGIEVTQIDVTYEASSLAFSGGQPFRQPNNDAQESKNHNVISGVLRASAYNALTETPAADQSAATSARLVLQGSSVEFSA